MLHAAFYLAFVLTLLFVGLTSAGEATYARTPASEDWVADQMARMTLEQKVSQLFTAFTFGHYTSVDDANYRRLVDLVERFEIGGLIFSLGDPLSQASLINDLQRRAGVPLLMAQDMEWGAGMRIDRATAFPRAMALGATRDPDFAFAVGYATATEAAALGIHQIYAPVADVNNNPGNPIINVRSFGEDPVLVSEMVTAFIRGVQAAGGMATVKHFPGHGDTTVDSHADLPVLPFDRARLDAIELMPFRAAIAAGVGGVMTAHLALPAFEADLRVPATLSPALTTRLLREDLGFDGLIVTDALDMAGVTKHFGIGEAAVRALEAGADILLMTRDEYAARAAILRAIASGRTTEARVDQSVRKILQAKAHAGLPVRRTVDLDGVRKNVATRPHLALRDVIARRSLTLLRNEGGLLPFDGLAGRTLVVTLSDDDEPDAGRFFARRLRAQAPGASFTTRLLDRRSAAADFDAVRAEIGQYDRVIVPAFVRVRDWSGSIDLPPTHRAFLNDILPLGKPLTLIAFGNPYISMGLHSQPAAFVAAYGDDEATQTAAAQALFGESGFGGRLPVTVPGTYAFGEGLMLGAIGPRRAYPEEVGMDGDVLARIDSLLHAAIAAKAFPGAAVAIGRADAVVKLDGYGYFTYDAEQPVTPQSPFDLASLTKVIATTTALMKLYEAGQIDLDAPVARYLPAFGANGKAAVTIRHLLTHTGGLIPFRPFHTMGFRTRQEVIDAIMNEGLEYTPGSESRYSDFGPITLTLVIEAITGEGFGDYVRKNVFEPLGMRHTGFRPTGTPDTLVVPTEVDAGFRQRLIQGEVHDETAWLLGGTAGHAGLFSTAADLARFAFMMVNEGQLGGRSFLRPETVRLFTTAVDPTGGHTRALGWDTRSREGYSSAGQFFGPRSFGHTGFTGTSMWFDPDAKLFVILLTNRVYPTRDNRGHIPVRPALADLAYQALRGAPKPLLPGR